MNIFVVLSWPVRCRVAAALSDDAELSCTIFHSAVKSFLKMIFFVFNLSAGSRSLQSSTVGSVSQRADKLQAVKYRGLKKFCRAGILADHNQEFATLWRKKTFDSFLKSSQSSLIHKLDTQECVSILNIQRSLKKCSENPVTCFGDRIT